ncbi:2',3'-cyclic-nucleotide 2'-phosphodiesterase [Bacillus carboniphilus]|uniref:2',3'-cyclic-nucleotide 2'-phosphodiesterase n=1 Tax=Bacillus carboniphilus TaxID=86663 RepID=A0ABN0WC37_9BACI
MRILFVGDVVSSLGRSMVKEYLPKLKDQYRPNFTIVNGENAAGGRGITHKIYNELLEWGAQAVTLGNHTWDHKEIFDFIDDAKQLVRPANFPEGSPGEGLKIIEHQGKKVAVISVQGRTFMPAIDDPFRAAEKLVEKARSITPYVFVDFHAEASSEKLAMGWFLDGKASAVVGTHTHIQTADERILTKGTAYLTDVGMTGPYDEIIGVDKEAVIRKFLTAMPVRFDFSKSGRSQLSAVVIDLDDKTGMGKKVERVLINDDHMFYY